MRHASPARALAALACLLLAACSASPATTTPSAPPASAAASATQGAGNPSPVESAATSTQPGGETDDCALFTTDRLASVVGEPVHVGDTSLLFGMGCRWDTADGRGGVVVQHQPVHLGYGDIAAQDEQRAVAAIVGDGFVSVTVAPAPSDDAVIGLLRELAGRVR